VYQYKGADVHKPAKMYRPVMEIDAALLRRGKLMKSKEKPDSSYIPYLQEMMDRRDTQGVTKAKPTKSLSQRPDALDHLGKSSLYSRTAVISTQLTIHSVIKFGTISKDKGTE
jgi:hypothetical protein